MPREVLTGFFGKLPSTGDFVSRGLPPAFRSYWDGWCSRHLAPRLARSVWPEGGLRVRMVSGGRVAAGVVLPGQDSAGRRFPLAAFVIADALPDPAALDPWCDRAAGALAAALRDKTGPDDLWEALEGIPTGESEGAAATSPELLLWQRDVTAQPCDPDEPRLLLDGLIPVSCC